MADEALAGRNLFASCSHPPPPTCEGAGDPPSPIGCRGALGRRRAASRHETPGRRLARRRMLARHTASCRFRRAADRMSVASTTAIQILVQNPHPPPPPRDSARPALLGNPKVRRVRAWHPRRASTPANHDSPQDSEHGIPSSGPRRAAAPPEAAPPWFPARPARHDRAPPCRVPEFPWSMRGFLQCRFRRPLVGAGIVESSARSPARGSPGTYSTLDRHGVAEGLGRSRLLQGSPSSHPFHSSRTSMVHGRGPPHKRGDGGAIRSENHTHSSSKRIAPIRQRIPAPGRALHPRCEARPPDHRLSDAAPSTPSLPSNPFPSC